MRRLVVNLSHSFSEVTLWHVNSNLKLCNFMSDRQFTRNQVASSAYLPDNFLCVWRHSGGRISLCPKQTEQYLHYNYKSDPVCFWEADCGFGGWSVGALVTAYGMPALTYTVLALAHVGNYVVVVSTIYGGTLNFLKEIYATLLWHYQDFCRYWKPVWSRSSHSGQYQVSSD